MTVETAIAKLKLLETMAGEKCDECCRFECSCQRCAAKAVLDAALEHINTLEIPHSYA